MQRRQIISLFRRNGVCERMAKINCWEFKKCGRQPGGNKSQELGVCPVATFQDYDGAHDGSQGGRSCWAVSESLCGGQKQGGFVQKLDTCRACGFYQAVKREEESGSHGFAVTPVGIRIYLRKRFKQQGDSCPASSVGEHVVGAAEINEIEKKFLFIAGQDGKRTIDFVYVELQYRRGSGMSANVFQRFLQYVMHALKEDQRTSFLHGLPASVLRNSANTEDKLGQGYRR